MHIYLDNCCYNRPYDNQTQDRVRIESEIILSVLEKGRTGIYTIIGSDVNVLEINRIADSFEDIDKFMKKTK